MKDFNIMGFTEKSDFQWRSLKKKQYIGGNCLKRGAWAVCRFKGGGGQGVLGGKSTIHTKLQQTCFPISHEVKEMKANEIWSVSRI